EGDDRECSREEPWKGGWRAWCRRHARHPSLDARVEDQAVENRETPIHGGLTSAGIPPCFARGETSVLFRASPYSPGKRSAAWSRRIVSLRTAPHRGGESNLVSTQELALMIRHV